MSASRLGFTLTQMEYVVALYRTQSFARAAKECGVSQPTLSMQVQKLEDQLQCLLFDRSIQPIQATDTAKPLIDQMQQALFEAQRIPALVEELHSAETVGSLTVGVIPTVATHLVPKVAYHLQEKYPKLQVTIEEHQTHSLVELLRNDTIDVGILAFPLNDARIFEKPLYREPFVFVCRKDHPLAKRKSIEQHDLELKNLWLLEEGHCFRSQVLELCDKRGFERTKRPLHLQSGNLETLKNLVSEMGGCTLLPGLSANTLHESLCAIPFRNPAPSRSIGLALRRKHHKVKRIQALENAILNTVPKPFLHK